MIAMACDTASRDNSALGSWRVTPLAGPISPWVLEWLSTINHGNRSITITYTASIIILWCSRAISSCWSGTTLAQILNFYPMYHLWTKAGLGGIRAKDAMAKYVLAPELQLLSFTPVVTHI